MNESKIKTAHLTIISSTLSPCGSFIVYGTNEPKLYIFAVDIVNLNTNTFIDSPPLHVIDLTDHIGWHSLCSNDKHVFFCSANSVVVFEWKSGQIGNGILKLVSRQNLCLVDSLHQILEIVSCSEDGCVKVWDIDLGKDKLSCTLEPGCVDSLIRPKLGNWITCVASDLSSLDSLACGGGPCLALWNLRMRRPLVRLDTDGMTKHQKSTRGKSNIKLKRAPISLQSTSSRLKSVSTKPWYKSSKHKSANAGKGQTVKSRFRDAINSTANQASSSTSELTTSKGQPSACNNGSGGPQATSRKVKKTKFKSSSRSYKTSRPDNPEIWFDDVDPALIAASREEEDSQYTTPKSLVKTCSFTGHYHISTLSTITHSPTRRVGIDCEFVGVGFNGRDNALARVSVVNQFGHLLYDAKVRPKERVVDYRTQYSGIRPADLRPDGPALPFEQVHAEVARLVKGRVLVGHSLSNDLKVLMLAHPRRDLRDTAQFRPFRRLFNGGTPSLAKLTEKVLGIKVQIGEHDSIEDARAAMRLYTSVKHVWESKTTTTSKQALPFLTNVIQRPFDDKLLGKLDIASEYKSGIESCETSSDPQTHCDSTYTTTSNWDPIRRRKCSGKRSRFLKKQSKRKHKSTLRTNIH